MPWFEDEVVALEAVDATLAGEPVDPAHAELAELALLLAAERPTIDPRFAVSLDEAVQRRFAPVGAAPPSRAKPRRWWLWTPAAGLAAALVAALVIVVAGANHRAVVYNAESSGAGRFAAKAPTPSGARGRALSGSPALATPHLSASVPPTASSNPLEQFAPSAAATGAGIPVQPPANGRKIIQSAQLALTTAPSRIDEVAQELFVVVGQVRGIVNNSNVTATSGPGGYAQFQLSIPSSMLPQAMASLSSLRYAKVTSRTDSTQDVNDQYTGDVRALADARALRTSLLKQLASASTQAQIDSLTARIHDAEASISSDEATLRSLNRQINYSQVEVTINGGPVPVPVQRGQGGFGLGRAAHDAGRVLTVAAGIALIAAAALLPVSLLGALGWWIAGTVRRRRREQALDLV
jgi:hypothetical protein